MYVTVVAIYLFLSAAVEVGDPLSPLSKKGVIAPGSKAVIVKLTALFSLDVFR